MGEDRKVYKVLVGKPKGRRPLGRPSCRWEAGIRMKLKEIGWGCVEDSCERCDEPSGSRATELVKYRNGTTADQDSNKKTSIALFSLRFVCRPDRAIILQVLKSFITVFLNDTHSV
jgi:hypothetical protein